ncbi:MAG: hypothetical protein SGI99_07980 [Pseudomonadota bacterium]|nr:hypothetical protein [Pseudomonadota bacterium]
MIDLLAQAVILLAGLFLAYLGVSSLAAPVRASRFLLGFAASPLLHWLELALRCIVGIAFLLHAPEMRYSPVFKGLGWVLLLTTAALMLVPWHLHRRFTQKAVPQALRFLPLIGVASLLLGGFVLFALFGSRI